MKTFQHAGRITLQTTDATPDENFFLLAAVDSTGRAVTVCFTGRDAEALRKSGIPTRDALLEPVEAPKNIQAGRVWRGGHRALLDMVRERVGAWVTPISVAGRAGLTAETAKKNGEIGRAWTDALNTLEKRIQEIAGDAEEESAPDLNTNGGDPSDAIQDSQISYPAQHVKFASKDHKPESASATLERMQREGDELWSRK
jgi:hypothetical protein